MDKLYYNVNKIWCIDDCTYTKIDKQIPKIGSSLCDRCKYQLQRADNEHWIICKLHKQYIEREEKLKRIFDGK